MEDSNDDTIMYNFADLATWTEAPISNLDVVFKDTVLSEIVSLERRLQACDLIGSCLQADPSLRPTIQEVPLIIQFRSCPLNLT